MTGVLIIFFQKRPGAYGELVGEARDMGVIARAAASHTNDMNSLRPHQHHRISSLSPKFPASKVEIDICHAKPNHNVHDMERSSLPSSPSPLVGPKKKVKPHQGVPPSSSSSSFID